MNSNEGSQLDIYKNVEGTKAIPATLKAPFSPLVDANEDRHRQQTTDSPIKGENAELQHYRKVLERMRTLH